MKRRILFIAILTISLLITSSCSTNTAIKYTTDEKVEDFLFAYDLLEKEYPLFGVKSRQYGVSFLDKKDEYLKRIKDTKNDKEFFMELYKVLSELRDGHTNIIPPPFYYMIEELIDEDDMDYNTFHDVYLLEPMENAKEDYAYWDEVLGGVFDKYKKQLNSLTDDDKIELKNYHNGNTAYIKFNSFTVTKEGCEKVYSFVKDSKDCSSIIVDIRDNSGGSDLQWLENIAYPLMNEKYIIEKLSAFRGGVNGDYFIELATSNDNKNEKLPINIRPQGLYYPPEVLTDFKYLLKAESTYEPQESIGFKGDIYVLINDKVYSSGEGFATFCKRTGFATLIGERTRGDGGSTAPILVKLPNSGLLFRMRLQMTLNPDGTASAEYGTAPDIEVNQKDALSETLKIIESKTE